MNVVGAQFLALQRRGAILGLAALSVVLTFAGVIAVTLAGGTTGAPPGPGGGGLTLAEIASSGGLADVLRQGSTLVGAVSLAVVASVMASEFSVGTIRNLLLREPRRARLLAGLFTASAAAVALGMVVACVVASAAVTVAAASRGIDTSAWWTAAGARSTAGAVLGLTAGAVGWCLLGGALGVLTRSTAIAVGAGLAYALPVETILRAFWNGSRWLPGQVLGALAGDGSIGVRAAAATAAIYLAVALVAAMVVFVRRDVAS